MSLWAMSLSGAVMIIAIVILRALLINQLPKKTFLILWGIVMVRLVIPFTAPSAFSIYSLIPEKEQSMNTQFSGIQDNLSENLPVNAMADTVHIDRTTQISIKWLVWLAGLCLCAGYFLIVYRKLYREFQMSFLVKIPQIEQWLVLHNGKRRIEIRQSDRVAAPVSYGIIHPIILFPKNTDWENMNVLQYVLEHEYVHIKRYDSITKLLVTAIVCIHWFNPMVWVMYILFNRDLELACDECVIHRFGNNSKSTYAHTLISMEEQKSGFMPFCNNFSKNAIEERITAIMKAKESLKQTAEEEWNARREALQDKHSLNAQIKLAYQEEQDRANVWHIDTKKFLAGAMGEDGKDNKERLKEMVELTQRDAHTLNYSKVCDVVSSTLFDNLSKCEHLRWNACMELQGFVTCDGDKDFQQKKHKCIVDNDILRSKYPETIPYDQCVVELSFRLKKK